MPTNEATTAPQGVSHGHRRRSRWLTSKFLVFFLTVATLLGGAALVAPQFQEKASAVDDGKDIVWDIAGGTKAYSEMIQAVRQRATGGAVLREGILQTNPGLDPKDPDNIFAVELRHTGVAESSGAPRVRLLLRARDLFVIGWQLTTSSDGSGGTILWFKGDKTEYVGSDPREDAATVRDLNFTGSYTDLERIGGVSRNGLELSEPALEQAFRDLRASGERTRTDTTASAAMTFIMVIAEAARFDPLEQRFRDIFSNGICPCTHTVSAAEAQLMNSWSTASTQVVNNLNDRTPINFRIDDPATPGVEFEATTLQAIAAILAIAILSEAARA